MENTANRICRCIVSLLEKHGVKRAIVSPGSRNAPLLIALSRSKSIVSDVVVDERSAGFIALGYATVSEEPVALVCTSGSALLNYGPAIAEAFYRKTPLIVISADRPKEWIGQDDSQTIVQYNALSNYVKKSYDLPAGQGDNDIWYANRVVNDALLTAINGKNGPVHVNVQLAEPLGAMIDDSIDADNAIFNRHIQMVKPFPQLAPLQSEQLAECIASHKKVMIVVGFMPPNKVLNTALNTLSNLPNIVVLTETIANISGNRIIGNVDAALSSIKDDDTLEMIPDVVISTGGALVSRHIKQFIRNHKVKEHWHVGEVEDTVDCFMQLTLRVEISPEVFFSQLASSLLQFNTESDYAQKWETIRNRAVSLTSSYAAQSTWSDFKAFATFIPLIPQRWNVQYSNGTAIRYAQIFGNHKYHRCDCNRGVSGIDGCTSTAIGAALAYKPETTLLVTGDMSFKYDISALLSTQIGPHFKIIVINNNGGGIFRFIASTSNLDIREKMFCCPTETSYEELFKAHGFAFFEANDEEELRSSFEKFASETSLPSALVVNTDGELSAQILKDYFLYNKSN